MTGIRSTIVFVSFIKNQTMFISEKVQEAYALMSIFLCVYIL